MRFFTAMLILSLSFPLAAAPIRVTGRVANWDQESGIAGARVELFPAYGSRLTEKTKAPLASTRTDTEGFFEIAAPEDDCFRLVVRAEGYVAMEHPLAPLVEDRQLSTVNLVPSRDQPVEDAEARIPSRRVLGSDRPWGWRLADQKDITGPAASPLVPPRRISGKVTDSSTGKPVAGALVWSGWPLVVPPVRADAEGRFHLDLPGAPPGEGVWLESGAAGFLPAERQYARPGETPVLVKLDPAAEISVRVSGPAGKPVANVSIQLDPPRAINKYEDVFEIRSGADGRFRLTGLKPGTSYKLTARRKGFERTTVPARTAPAGQPPPPPVQIVLGTGKTAFGRIVDAAGRPVAEVKIILFNQQTYLDQQEATTNAEGRFEIRHLSPGAYMLTAYHPERTGLEMLPVEVPPAPPSVDLGDLKLPADGAIEGRVTDSQGKPVEGAEVHVNESQNLEASLNLTLGEGLVGQPSLRSLRTGPDGSFRAKGLKSGGLFDLRVQHPDYAEATVAGVEVPTQDPVRIELKAGHGLTGRVVDAGGKPVAGASVAWIERTGGIAGLFGSRRPLGVTNAEGRFQTSGLPAGNLDLEVSAEGYQTRWMDGLRVPEEGNLEDLKVVLGRGSWLDVRVLNAAGEPVPDSPVVAQSQNLDMQNPRTLLRAFSHCETDSQGRCRLSLPEPGSYTVQILDGTNTMDVTAAPGGTPVEIRLPAGYSPFQVQASAAEPVEDSATEEAPEPDAAAELTLSGRVLVDGVPLGGASVLAGNRENKRSGQHIRTAYDGSFTLRGLPPGPLTLIVLGSPGILASRTIQLDENGEIEIEITTGTFKATVLSATGEPLEGAVATLEPWDPDPELQVPFAALSARSGPDGTLDTGRLAPGTYRMEINKEGFQPRQEMVEVRPGGGTVIEVRLAVRE